MGQNYAATVMKAQKPSMARSSTPATAGTDASSDYDDGSLPPIDELVHQEQFEKVKKLQIDNATKIGTVVSKKLVELMIDKIDEALNRIILDGRASFIPRLCKKIRGGATDEEAAKFWHDEITKYISPVKPYMIRVLKKHNKGK